VSAPRAAAHWLPGEAWEAPVCPRHVWGKGETVALRCLQGNSVCKRSAEGDGSYAGDFQKELSTA